MRGAGLTACFARAPDSFRWPVPLNTEGSLLLLGADQGNGLRLVAPEPWPFCPGLGSAQVVDYAITAFCGLWGRYGQCSERTSGGMGYWYARRGAERPGGLLS